MVQSVEGGDETDSGASPSSTCTSCVLSPGTQELLKRVFQDIVSLTHDILHVCTVYTCTCTFSVH